MKNKRKKKAKSVRTPNYPIKTAQGTALRGFFVSRGRERKALPIGNGRLGAMVFGGLGRDRIALNEESMWSGSRAENDRADAAKNLPEIRRLLLEGRNADAEALVNQTFTCQGAGSGRGAGSKVPFGCYQSLGDLNIVWKSDDQPAALNDWKWTVIPANDIKEAKGKIADAVKPDAKDKDWKDYLIADGKSVRGGYEMQDKEYVVLRHHLQLTMSRQESWVFYGSRRPT